MNTDPHSPEAVAARKALTAGMTTSEARAFHRAQKEAIFAARRVAAAAARDADWARSVAKLDEYEAPENHPAIVNAMVA